MPNTHLSFLFGQTLHTGSSLPHADEPTGHHLFEESNIEQEMVVYRTYYPIENNDDYIYIRDNKNCYGIFLMKDTNMQNLKSFAVV